MCQAAHRVLGLNLHLSGPLIPVRCRSRRDEATRLKCLSSTTASSLEASPEADSPAGTLKNRKVLRISALKWSKELTARAKSPRRTVVVNSTTLVTKSWVSTDEMLDTSAAAAMDEAMTVARAAANAARAAAAFAEAQSQSLSKSPKAFPSGEDLLLLERAWLEEMASLSSNPDKDSIGGSETENDPVDFTFEKASIFQRGVDAGSNLGAVTELAPDKEACYERSVMSTNNVAVENINVAAENVNVAAAAENENENVVAAENENVAVRSSKRKERILKRERVSTKTPVRLATHSKAKKLHHAYDASDPVRAYMRDIGRSKLLTGAEEVGLAEGIQDLLRMESVKATLTDRMGREPSLAEWASALEADPHSLESRIKMGQACKDRMVNSNLRLVVSIAKRYVGRGMSIQDLIQEGSLGLIRGAEKFDHTRGFKFSTYAHWWIRQAITRAIADQSRTIRLPVHVYELLSRITKAKSMLTAEHGRVPRDEDVAELVGLNIEKLQMVMKAAKNPKSMEFPVGNNNDTLLGEMVADKFVDSPEDAISKRLLKHDLETVLNTLSTREREVLRLRYGLDDGKMRTLEDIGNIYRVTRERIRQIEAKALRKLRQPSRNTSLREYLKLSTSLL